MNATACTFTDTFTETQVDYSGFLSSQSRTVRCRREASVDYRGKFYCSRHALSEIDVEAVIHRFAFHLALAEPWVVAA